MIIDVHGHYTTAPKQREAWRHRQIAGIKDKSVMPRAADLPFFKVGNHVTACTHNPLGVKGVGEVGAIGVPPAACVAVEDTPRGLRAAQAAGMRTLAVPSDLTADQAHRVATSLR